MYQGYIKLHRKLLDNCIMQHPELLQLWIYCLLQAQHKEQVVWTKSGRGLTEVKLQRGQFIFGRDRVSKELKCKPTTLYNRMQKLKKLGFLDIETDRQFSIVTVCNWDIYQLRETENGQLNRQTNDRLMTDYRQTNDTYKNVKNDNNITPPIVPPTEGGKGERKAEDNKSGGKAEADSEFEQIWSAYPRQQGYAGGLKVWRKIRSEVELTKVLEAIDLWKRSKQWKREGGRYIPKLAKWLAERGWVDVPAEIARQRALDRRYEAERQRRYADVSPSQKNVSEAKSLREIYTAASLEKLRAEWSRGLFFRKMIERYRPDAAKRLRAEQQQDCVQAVKCGT